MGNPGRRWEGQGSEFRSVSGKRIKGEFLGSDFHMPELCNRTNICGSPPALHSRHGSPPRNVPAYQSPCWPQTALQLTLAIGNSTFSPRTRGVTPLAVPWAVLFTPHPSMSGSVLQGFLGRGRGM